MANPDPFVRRQRRHGGPDAQILLLEENMRVRIIANPVSGRGKGRIRAEALHDALQGRVETVDLILTQRAGEGEQAARSPDADCVVAVGGDGSVNEVINGLRDSQVLAILPSGTANVVARELRIPRHPQLVADLIAERQLRRIDVGLHSDRRFLLGAGAGLDAAVVEAVSRQRGQKANLRNWVWPTIQTMRTYTFPKFRVLVDDQEVSDQSQYAIVGNCRYSAGIFPATPKAEIDDGLLDICVFHDLNKLRLLKLLFAVWRTSYIHRNEIIYRQGRTAEFQALSREMVPLQVDGDPAGPLPARFGVVPRGIQVVAPTDRPA